MKFLSRPAVALAVKLLSTTAISASQPETGPLACDFSKETSPMVTAQITNLDIEGAVLEFPEDYVLSLPFKSGEIRGGLLLRADVKDFSSYPKSKLYFEGGTYKQRAGIRDWMLILISSKLPMEIVWERMYISAYPDITHKNFQESISDLVPAPFGLKKPRKLNTHNFRTPDIFVRKEASGIQDVIRCNKVGSVPSPGCTQVFESDAYDITLSFARSELARWNVLRNGVSKLIRCFTIRAPIELPNVKLPGE